MGEVGAHFVITLCSNLDSLKDFQDIAQTPELKGCGNILKKTREYFN